MVEKTFEWYSDVSAERPIYRQITRNSLDVDYLEFNGSGQRLKTNLSKRVQGTMIHVTVHGTFRIEVDISAGTYEYLPYQSLWGIEELILFDRTLTDTEYTFFINEINEMRNRKINIDQTDWSNLFRNRNEIRPRSGDLDFTGATNLIKTFQNSNASQWLSSSFLDTAVNVTNFNSTFLGNNLTSIPDGLFDNMTNVTDFGFAFFNNNLTSIPAGLFDNTPNVTNFNLTFFNNNLTSIPANLFDTQTIATNYDGCFGFNDIDATGVDNILVSVLKSADDNDLINGDLNIDGGTNATPTTTGQSAADTLRARGWTVNLNGY